MCGIVAYMALSGREETVGRTVLAMLDGLAQRGPDSAGAAIFASEAGTSEVCWIRGWANRNASSRRDASTWSTGSTPRTPRL